MHIFNLKIYICKLKIEKRSVPLEVFLPGLFRFPGRFLFLCRAKGWLRPKRFVSL